MNHRLVSIYAPSAELRWRKLFPLLTTYFSDVDVSCFLLTFWWRPIFPRHTHRERGKSLFFTFLLISCTITTLSDGCHHDWDFNFALASPRRSHELTFKFCGERRGSALQWPSLTACFSNYFWKGERLYGGPGIHHCQPPVALPLWRCPAWAMKHREPPGLCGAPPSITSASCHLRHRRWVIGDSFVLLNFSLSWEKRSSSEEDVEEEECALQSHLFGLSWNCVTV